MAEKYFVAALFTKGKKTMFVGYGLTRDKAIENALERSRKMGGPPREKDFEKVDVVRGAGKMPRTLGGDR